MIATRIIASKEPSHRYPNIGNIASPHFLRGLVVMKFDHSQPIFSESYIGNRHIGHKAKTFGTSTCISTSKMSTNETDRFRLRPLFHRKFSLI